MVRCNSIEASTRSSMAEFDDSELFRSSECQENSDQVDLKFLSGENYRLVPTTSKLLEKFDSMDVKFTEIQKTLSQLCNQLGIEAEPSRQKLPVTHSDPYTREASNRLTLDNRKSLLRKIEMPKFDGSNASDWLSKVERFFRVGRYSDLEKLDLVAFSLERDVLKWFNWKLICGKFHSWDDFRRRLLLKYGAASEESPRNRLFAIKQTGTVSDYVTQFEELSAQVIGLDELHLEEIFYKGLKPAMREVLKLKEPVGLENQKKAVLRMGTSSFCHLSSAKSTKAWGSQKPFTPKPVTTSTQPRPLLLPIGEGQGTGQIVAATPPVLPPHKRHTAEQQPVHKEDLIPHLQVPVCKLQKHSLPMHNESPNVCENSQAVVSCDGLGKEVNILSGLSQNRQVWEPGGVFKLKEPVGLVNQKKSRCLQASRFNFKRKKKKQENIVRSKINNMSLCFGANFGLVRNKRTFQCLRLQKQAHKSRVLYHLRMLHDPGGTKDEHSDEIFDTEVDIDKVQRIQMDTVAESHSDVASSTDVITKGQTPACAVVKYSEPATSAHVMQTADWDEACGADIDALEGTGTCIVTFFPARCGWLVFDRGKTGQLQWTEIQTISLYKEMVADPVNQAVLNLVTNAARFGFVSVLSQTPAVHLDVKQDYMQNQVLPQSHKFIVDTFGRLNNTRLTVLRVVCLLSTLFWSTSFKKQKFGKNWWYKFKVWQRIVGSRSFGGSDCGECQDFASLYPAFKLEDKLVLRGESIDTIQGCDDVATSSISSKDSDTSGGFAVVAV